MLLLRPRMIVPFRLIEVLAFFAGAMQIQIPPMNSTCTSVLGRFDSSMCKQERDPSDNNQWYECDTKPFSYHAQHRLASPPAYPASYLVIIHCAPMIIAVFS